MVVVLRVQELAFGYSVPTWTDLLRVDVLNILGLSMMLMGVLCWLTASRSHVNSTASRSHMNLAADGTVAAARIRTLVAAIFVAAIVAMATPPLWTPHRPKFLPWPIQSYINGAYIFCHPQPRPFPRFPWLA